MNHKSPALRFKDDQGNDYPDWEKKKLGDVSSLISGHHLSPTEYDSGGEGVPYFTGPSDFTNDPSKFTKWTKLNSKVAPQDSVLITVKGSGVGKLMYSRLPEVAMGRQLMAVNSESSSNFLIYQYLHTKAQYFQALASGNMIPGLSRPDLLSTKIPTATLPEQQKIANFLTAVDERIQQLIQKKALLEDYKKGVMQQLFSQTLRFKDDDGNDFPDWEEKKLLELVSPVRTKNRDMAIKLVLTNSATRGIIKQRDYFDKDIANAKNLGGYYVVNKDDFVYNPRISGTAPVGPIKQNHIATGVMSPLYTVFKLDRGNSSFFEFYFQTNEWHPYMNSVANFGARHDRMAISTNDFYRLPVPFPSVQEQTKIVDFLSAIDRKIESVASQIDETQAFKRGLLQQMFV
jgi:type I restriction enzyme S subunit